MTQYLRTDGHVSVFIPGSGLPNVDRYGVTVTDPQATQILIAASAARVNLEHSPTVSFDPRLTGAKLPWPFTVK